MSSWLRTQSVRVWGSHKEANFNWHPDQVLYAMVQLSAGAKWDWVLRRGPGGPALMRGTCNSEMGAWRAVERAVRKFLPEQDAQGGVL